MRSNLKFIFLYFLFSLLSSIEIFATPRTQTQQKIAQIQIILQEKKAIFQNEKKAYSQISTEIDSLKAPATNLFKKAFSMILLQKKLSDAQEMAMKLETLSLEIKSYELKLIELRKDELQFIQQHILISQTELTYAKKTTRKQLLLNLQKLILEKEFLEKQTSPSQTLLSPHPDLFTKTFSSEEIDTKLRVLRDIQKNYQSEVTLIQKQSSDEKRKQQIQRELKAFSDEENFFGEQNFVRGASRLNVASNTPSKTDTTEPKTTPSDTTPTSSPNTPSPSTENPQTPLQTTTEPNTNEAIPNFVIQNDSSLETYKTTIDSNLNEFSQSDQELLRKKPNETQIQFLKRKQNFIQDVLNKVQKQIQFFETQKKENLKP